MVQCQQPKARRVLRCQLQYVKRLVVKELLTSYENTLDEIEAELRVEVVAEET